MLTGPETVFSLFTLRGGCRCLTAINVASRPDVPQMRPERLGPDVLLAEGAISVDTS